jgi:transcriptional regulator with XRE-family HTH domain
MAQVARRLHPSVSPRHYFGAELRRLRERAHLSQAQLGSRICFSADLIRRVETAERHPSRRFAELCDAALQSGGVLARLWPLLERQSSRPPAPAAPPVSGVELLSRVPFQPGVLDRAALDWLTADPRSSPDRIARGPDVTWVTDEDVQSAAEVLATFRTVDHTTGAGHVHARVQAFVDHELAQLLDATPTDPAVGRRLSGLAAGFFELCGYQAVDTGADGLAQRHYLRALRLAQVADDRAYGGYLLAVNIAHLALHCNHPEPALRLAMTAIAGTEDSATPTVQAALHAVVARAHARLGREAECTTHLIMAENQLAADSDAAEPTWISYFTPAYLADEMAHCFHDLGRPDPARRHVEAALAGLDRTHVRRLAIDTALLGSSLAASGRVDEACAVTRAAVDHAAATASHRCLQRIVDVQVELEPYRTEREVRELRDHVRTRLPAATW